MSRGKKTSPGVIHEIMASWMITNNFKETAENLGLPLTTVKEIVDKNRDKPEFVELRNEKMKEFSDRASEIIQKGLTLLDKRFDRAIASEEDLDVLIDEIFASGKDEISADEKMRLVNKIRALQLQDIRAITTAIGTLYDKKALADGSSTSNLTVEVKLPPGADEYAG